MPTVVEIRCGFEAVTDLATANLRLNQLASVSAGEYFVFNLRTHQVPIRLVSAHEPEKHDPVKSHHYDIVRKEDNKSAIWLEGAPDLDTAESRIHDLASFWPGEFQIMDQQNHQVVDKIISRSDPTQVMTKATPGDRSRAMSRMDMRKRQIIPTLQGAEPSDQVWLDMDRNVLVEVTSEEKGYPIESALLAHESESPGWRAANSGIQIIRMTFDEPQTLRRIWLVFEDTENTRTQEFVLRWSPSTEHAFREIVRQPWNFSPSGSIREIEDYTVGLSEVAVLELTIVPDKSGGEARASLKRLRLA